MKPKLTEYQGMQMIAELLGTAEDWSPAADFLEDIANIVYQAGFPHPGDTSPEDYAEQLETL